jgi:hypothetical protein
MLRRSVRVGLVAPPSPAFTTGMSEYREASMAASKLSMVLVANFFFLFSCNLSFYTL